MKEREVEESGVIGIFKKIIWYFYYPFMPRQAALISGRSSGEEEDAGGVR